MIEGEDSVGFRSPTWGNPCGPLGGSTVFIRVWRNVTKAQALANANIETLKQARRNGNTPIGGFGTAKYIAALHPSGQQGAPERLRETTIAGLPALAGETTTWVYPAHVKKTVHHARAAEGRLVFLMGSSAYALLYAPIYNKAFGTMAGSFRFIRPAPAPAWKVYRSQTNGFELRYPPDWKVLEHKDYIGFRNPSWDDPCWPIGGSSVTVRVWRNVTKAQALANAYIETRAQAQRNGDKPIGGFGDARYIYPGDAGGPPERFAETSIAGLHALVAEIGTRLYHRNVNGFSGYAGAADGKVVFLMGSHVYALLYAAVEDKAFDAMVRSFRFIR